MVRVRVRALEQLSVTNLFDDKLMVEEERLTYSFPSFPE